MQQVLTIKLPDSVQLSQFELSMMLAAKMYERGILSAGQAAEVVGLTKRAFIELLGKYGVSVFGYSSLEELESELAHG
jgi:predicted HTH domain antitoxin